jgi:dTDP-4-amino-4,6-dideoxygalactose transaminase
VTDRLELSRPTLGDEEIEAVTRLLRDGGRLAGDGPIGRRVEARLREELGAECVLLTSSGTAAMEMAMLVLGIGPGDEVVTGLISFHTYISIDV